MNFIFEKWSLFRWSSSSELLIAASFGLICGIGAVIAPSLTIIAMIAIAAFTFGSISSRPMVMCYLLVIFIILTSAMPRGRIIPQLAPNELILFLTLFVSLPYVITKQQDKPLPTAILFGLIVMIWEQLLSL